MLIRCSFNESIIFYITIPRLIFFTLIVLLATGMSFLQRFIRPFQTSAPAAAMEFPAGTQKCTVAAGCFWGVEHLFRQHFDGKGLLDARVGYIGGDLKSPSYRAVCSGGTGRKCCL